MVSRKALIAALLVAISAIAAPALTVAAVNIDIDVAPPAPRVEVVPGPRHGYLWAPGHWEWRRHSHVWIGGYWIRERRGQHWVADRWVQAGPRWHYDRGHWER